MYRLTLSTYAGLANCLSRWLHLVDLPSRLAMDPYRLHGLALFDNADEATQLCRLQWLP